MTRHRPFGELSAGLRRRVADRDVERERIWHAINQAADEIRYTLFGSNLRDWLDRVARPLIFGDETSAGDSSGGPEFCSTCGTVVESSAGGASTREGEADPMMSAPSPPAEGAPGTRPPGAPPNHAGVVTYDAEACAAYVSVRPRDRVARTASVHPHDLVMLDYDDDGQLLGVEVLGIMHDEPPAGYDDINENTPWDRTPLAPWTAGGAPRPLTHYQWDPDIGWLAVCRKCGNGPLVGEEEQRGLCGECKVLADLQAHREGEPDG